MPLPAAPIFATRASAALLLLLLAGCGASDTKFAPTCPQLSLLADGADLVRFAGPGRDITDRVLEARITGVDAACRAGRNGDVVATLTLRADLARGPAARDRQAQIPYFVAVMDNEAVLDRQAFVLQGSFPANVSTLRIAGDELELRFPGTAERGAGRYRILVSLQLTEEELAYNRRTQR